MLVWKNRIKQGVTTGGSGNVVLGSALSGYQALGAGDTGKYLTVTFVDGTAWEVSRCLYTHATTSLSRTLINSSSGSLLTLSTNTTAEIDLTARDAEGLELAMRSVVPGGRLTLTTATPDDINDVVGGSTIYYTPYLHNVIPLWDGSTWRPVEFTEQSIALSGLTASRPYDVYAYLSGGALALEILAWSSDVLRAVDIARYDGRICKSGDQTRLLLGTFFATGTTTTEDSAANRYLCNVYNPIKKQLLSATGASHTIPGSMTAIREWNAGASTLPRVQLVTALPQIIPCAMGCQSNSVDAIATNTAMQLAKYEAGTLTSLMIGFTPIQKNSMAAISAQSAFGSAFASFDAGRYVITIAERNYVTDAITVLNGKTSGVIEV